MSTGCARAAARTAAPHHGRRAERQPREVGGEGVVALSALSTPGVILSRSQRNGPVATFQMYARIAASASASPSLQLSGCSLCKVVAFDGARCSRRRRKQRGCPQAIPSRRYACAVWPRSHAAVPQAGHEPSTEAPSAQGGGAQAPTARDCIQERLIATRQCHAAYCGRSSIWISVHP